jgi:ribosomal protein S18 acetylase RimI-like enzyme
MLAPAHIGHLALLRSIIRDTAAEGSFESGLAADNPQSAEFFAKLKRALVHGYFVEEDPRSGKVQSIAVPGYVFWPDDRNSGQAPVGFGLFRAVESGYELWLAGVEFGRRGDGHGRALIDALFTTPPGRKTWVVRIPRGSRYHATVQHLLSAHGFEHAGDTTSLRWFVRNDAPQRLVMRVHDIVLGHTPIT